MLNNITGSKQQMLYDGVSDHLHDDILTFVNESNNAMLNMFESDCDVIKHHLNITYNFDVIENSYKFIS